MRKAVLTAIVIIIAATLSAAPAYALKVVASFLPVYIFAKNVSGPEMDISILVPPGTEIHEFSPRPSDIKRLKDADLILLGGAGIEAPFMRAIDPKKVVDTSKGIDLIKGDPHMWLDPKQAEIQVENIAKALSDADPSNKAVYERNAQAYKERLRALDKEIRENLSGLKGRYLITFHEAFAYFARRYGLSYYSLTGLDAEAPLPGRMKAVYDIVKRESVKGIFGEKQFSARPLQRFKDDLGVEICTLDTLESGPAEKEQYEKAMRENMASIVRCLK